MQRVHVIETSGWFSSIRDQGKEVMSYSVIILWYYVISGLPSIFASIQMRSMLLSFQNIYQTCCISFQKSRYRNSKKPVIRGKAFNEPKTNCMSQIKPNRMVFACDYARKARDDIIAQSNYGKKKNQTSTSVAYYSSKNERNRLKFLLKLVLSIIELGCKNYWTASNSFWIIRNFLTFIDWQAICFRLVKMNEVQMVKFQKIILNVGRSEWNLKWKLSTL